MILLFFWAALFLALAVLCAPRRWGRLIGIVSPLLCFVPYLPLWGGRELRVKDGLWWLVLQGACLIACAVEPLLDKRLTDRARRISGVVLRLLTAVSAGWTLFVLSLFVCVCLDIPLLPVPGYDGH